MSTNRSHGRAWLDVNLANLVANARTILAQAPGARLLPMIKANAYGVGAIPAARALDALDPWGFGVATVPEAVELREAGVERPIVVFTPADLGEQGTFERYGLRAVLDRADVARSWSLPFHLEVDTGMSRSGVRWDDAMALAACASPKMEGVFTHLASADTDPRSVEVQWQRFEEARARLGPAPRLLHVANSAGAWRLRRPLDLVRPGIFLYGGRHAPDLPPPLPVVALRAPVVSLRRLAAGDPVSYGGEWRAPAATWVATLGIGYTDGVPRAVQGRATVLVGGARRPLVGRVTMDFVMVDLGPDPGPVQVGDATTLIGEQDGDMITVDEFAQWAGTISYEILARLGARVERRYGGASR